MQNLIHHLDWGIAHFYLLFIVVFPLPEDSTAFCICEPLSPAVHLSCFLIYAKADLQEFKIEKVTGIFCSDTVA